MSTTVNDIQNLVNQYIRDTSTDSVSANDRLRAITEAVRQLYSEFELDFTNRTYEVKYFDGLHYYDITTDIPDFLEPVDLRRKEGLHTEPFTRKSPREIAVEIDEGSSEKCFAIERRNRKNYLVINFTPEHSAITLHDCESLTSNGTWAADSTNSDALNLTLDGSEYKEGSGALNFDIDVSQSANNRATIANSTMEDVDLTDEEDLASFICWVYIPDVTNFTSVTVYWGSDSSNYWSGTATTDYAGAAFVDGWNRIKVDWEDTTKTGSPDVSAIDYLRLDFNYSASQGDDTDFRVDEILMVRPEKVDFYYQTWAVGEVSASDSTLVYDFTVTTNVPFYSGIYDYVNIYVAHLAAAILHRQTGMREDAADEERIAGREKERLKRKFPTSRITITRNFKVNLNW